MKKIHDKNTSQLKCLGICFGERERQTETETETDRDRDRHRQRQRLIKDCQERN